jgi:hypothetical protein
MEAPFPTFMAWKLSSGGLTLGEQAMNHTS